MLETVGVTHQSTQLFLMPCTKSYLESPAFQSLVGVAPRNTGDIRAMEVKRSRSGTKQAWDLSPQRAGGRPLPYSHVGSGQP